MNPSTEDILNAIEATPAKTVFVLPNNSNIILTAKQAKEIIKDKEVLVNKGTTLQYTFLSYMKSIGIEVQKRGGKITVNRNYQTSFDVHNTIYFFEINHFLYVNLLLLLKKGH